MHVDSFYNFVLEWGEKFNFSEVEMILNSTT